MLEGAGLMKPKKGAREFLELVGRAGVRPGKAAS